MDSINKCRLIIILVAICMTLTGTVIASDQVHTEAHVSSKRVLAPPQVHNAPVVHPIAATQDEFAPRISTKQSVQAPDHVIDPTALVAVADYSSQQAIDVSVGGLGGSIPVANAGIRHDDNLPAVTGDTTQLMDRAINNQGQTADNRADPVRFPYALAVVLIAFLGMISVIRRDTRQGKSK